MTVENVIRENNNRVKYHMVPESIVTQYSKCIGMELQATQQEYHAQNT